MKINQLIILFFLLKVSIPTINSQTLDWVKTWGNTQYDSNRSMRMDASGNIFITGTFTGTVDFDPGTNTHNLTSQSNYDLYLLKLDNNGNFVDVKQFRCNSMGSIYASKLIIDSIGNIFITGNFQGACDFDPSTNNMAISSIGFIDMFIVKLDNNINFKWVKQIGGIYDQLPSSITIDHLGNIITCGEFMGTTDFDPGITNYNLTSSTTEMFVLKLDSLGNFIWAKQMQSNSISAEAEPNDITIDNNNDIYITGKFDGTIDFNPDITVQNYTANGIDGFIQKLNSTGNLIWINILSGTSPNITPGNITTDLSNNVYITGRFKGTIDFNSGTGSFYLSSYKNTDDAFLLKIDNVGTFLWAKHFSGNGFEQTGSIAFDSNNAIYLSGIYSDSIDCDPSNGINILLSNGNAAYEGFLIKTDNSGNFITASGILDSYFNVITDKNDNIYLGGAFENTTDFDISTSTHNLTSAGLSDAFILKMNQSSVGLKEIANENDFIVYPNPSNTGIITILNSTKTKECTLRDVSGKVLLNEALLSEKFTINLSNYSTGIYFLSLTNNYDRITTKKIIINK